MNQTKLFEPSGLLIKKEYQNMVLLGFTLILYLKTIAYDYNLDDYIIMDSLDGKVNSIKDLAALLKLSYNNTDYRPIVFLSIGIERVLFGAFSPAVSHAVNCILYFLVCLSGLKLFTLIFKEEKNHLIFLSVLLFCVHPINTEVVASIKCRDNLLSLLFGLLSSIYYLKFIKNNKAIGSILLAFIFAILAIFSKLDSFGLLLFNLIFVVFYQEKKKILSIFYSIGFAVIVINIRFFVSESILENKLVGKITFTENPLAESFTFLNRLIAGINTIYIYTTKLVYISTSKYYYGYQYYDILSVKSISFIVGVVIVAVAIIGFIYSIQKQEKVVGIALIGIATTSIYALNIIQPVAGIIADRYIFITNLFYSLLFVYLFYKIVQRTKIKQYFNLLFLGIVIVYFASSFMRVGAWKNFRTLIDTDAPKLYSSYEAMRIATSAYFDEYKITEQKSDLEQAIFYAEKGNAVYPKNILLHLLTGQFYFKKNEYKNAIPNFIIAHQNDTSLSESLVYLGDTYYASKNLDSSLFYYQKAFIRDTKNAELINNISTVYFERGEKEKCLQYNYNLLKTDSTLYAAHENLGYYYLAEKDTTKAIVHFKTAIKYGLDKRSILIKIP